MSLGISNTFLLNGFRHLFNQSYASYFCRTFIFTSFILKLFGINFFVLSPFFLLLILPFYGDSIPFDQGASTICGAIKDGVCS